MSKYLLEIGVEEFPSEYIDSTKKQLKEKFQKLIDENKLSCEKIEVESTPRRFAVLLVGIEANQAENLISVRGPSKKIAYDENGDAQKPLLGFLKGQKAELSDVVIKEFKGEDYIFVEKKEESKSVKEVLETNVYDLVKSLSFKRSMRWGGKNIRFARPIRYFVSILDDQVLPFEAEGIKVSNITKGHRVLGSDRIVIDSIDKYESLLKENYVILKYKDRRDIIVRGLNKLSSEKGGSYVKDERLIDEVVNIVEYPTVLIGEIDTDYLKLPKEVVITPMMGHQRYFPVVDDKGSLMPYFLIVRNGDDTASQNVINGNKKVLVARLEDAKFFYDIDKSKKLDEYVDDLKDLTFFEGLGNMYQKSQRLVKLSSSYLKLFKLGEDVEQSLLRAAQLSKADLVTKMVIEFTELQGIMGRIYAKNSSEEDSVSIAIEEQYMPRNAEDKLPKTGAGIVLSIADKLDSIVGLYAIEKYVTGSQDPFALRRAAIGVINILIENKIDIDLEELIKDSLYIYTEVNALSFDYDTTVEKVIAFIIDRLRNILIEQGYRYDIVNSVIKSDERNVLRIVQKVKDISEFMENEDAEDALTYFRRINNLAKNANVLGQVDEDLLENDLERAYYNSIKNLDLDSFLNSKSYKEGLEALAANRTLGNEYLDKTMINVEDDRLKNNRLVILNTISQKIKEIFVIDEIVK
ncbi:MAG: glycine--tRNA ligase subunit beta [Peptoniphilaceae bacterium]|nr:glycine--tRNA ligase subunit beta [Peptoniphilaceae bacterium]MDY6018391.1 glycine--tRNA ligase subunit beta [Anaerococcus sp.]